MSTELIMFSFSESPFNTPFNNGRAYSASQGHQLNHTSGYGTNVEGPWDAVMAAIGECHAAVHAMGTPRIAVSFR
jgi:hypothetical protein